jgi:hypothetical protein
MIGTAIVADEEALVVVGTGGLVDGRGLLDGLVHRQVADVALVELQAELLRLRQRVELARGGEGRVHHRVRDAVAGQVEEADGLAGALNLAGDGLEALRVAGSERGGEIDDRDVPRGLVDILHRQGLEDVHDRVSPRPGS